MVADLRFGRRVLVVFIFALVMFNSMPHGQAHAAASANASPPAASFTSATSPLTVELSATPTTTNRAIVNIQITSTSVFSNAQIELTAAPIFTILSSTLPKQVQFPEPASKIYSLEVQASSIIAGYIQIYIQAADGNGLVGDLGRIWLMPHQGVLEVTSEPASFTNAGQEPSPQDPQFTIDDIMAMTANLRNGTQAQPNSQSSGVATTASGGQPMSAAAALAAITGVFQFQDHETATTGILATAIPKKIRRAWVSLQGKAPAGNWVDVIGAYTNDSGAFSISVDSTNIVGKTMRVIVCTIGPDANNIISVVNKEVSGTVWCAAGSKTMTGALTTNFGTQTLADTHQGSGPFNIYDDALQAYDYLVKYATKPAVKLSIVWYIGFNPIASSDSSYYTASRVNLNGTTTNGDQWDDSVILHEIGHWVMDKYAAYPPVNISPPNHGFCQEGKIDPYMEYAEGWADFFSSAVRSVSSQPDVKKWAGQYIDTAANNSGSINTSTIRFFQNVEASTLFDTTTTKAFRSGNFCEWQIAGALFDVVDSNADNHDTLAKSPKNVFTAFQTKFNGHYPYTINEWWYGWTNTLGNRSGSSLGSEQAMLDNFADHKIQIGVQFLMTWKSYPPEITQRVWLPQEGPFGGDIAPDSFISFPYSGGGGVITPLGQRQEWITSPYKGNYTQAVRDNTDCGTRPTFANTNATVTIYNGSIHDAAYDQLAPIVIQQSGTQYQCWWYVLDVNIETWSIRLVNQVVENDW